MTPDDLRDYLTSPSPVVPEETERALYDRFLKANPPGQSGSNNKEVYGTAFKDAIEKGQLTLASLFFNTEGRLPGTRHNYIGRLIDKEVVEEGLQILVKNGTASDIRFYLKNFWREHSQDSFRILWANDRCRIDPEISAMLVDTLIDEGYHRKIPDYCNFYLIPFLQRKREDLLETLVKAGLSSELIKYAIRCIQSGNMGTPAIAALFQTELRKRDMIAAGHDPEHGEAWSAIGTDTALQQKFSASAPITIAREFNFRSQTVLVRVKDENAICCTESPFSHYDTSELRRAYDELCARVTAPAPFKPEKRKEHLDFSIPEKRRGL